mmetsp:Transcript_3599/g.11822  ORF Transcript_3599/g.11822 Transcript_3599/m.11822 type:complete len:378 (+) Transcript_3599:927-2060(+)|eukprot:CAMPEP_0118918218 /NCGR_PEP_ID=MMETSP1166-20130328/17762_1 /TAXON_ID=1104430 /ORGANISM="Chrysoreinhardia sp, Strain CCMP3193" /LENGTH=377 /DNA_ID=CAMNT_0006858465 /DNA_START=779 /DNA_END=1912 /DNA_ORIENTATION=+
MLAIGSYSEKLDFVDGKGEGIYVVTKEGSRVGVPSSLVRNSSYLCTYSDAESTNLYAVDEGDRGRVVALSSTLEVLSRVDCGDSSSCFVVATRRYVFVANYCGGETLGSVAAVRRDEKTGALLGEAQVLRPWEGSGVTFPRGNPQRQDKSHVHMCLALSPLKFLLAPDLGCDVVWRVGLRKAEEEEDTPLLLKGVTVACRCAEGDGPRHCAVEGNLIYVVTELSRTLQCFRDEGGDKEGTLLETVRLRPDKNATAAALRVTKKAAYCSLRVVDGEGLVVVVPLDDDGLPVAAKATSVGTDGHTPRDIQLFQRGTVLLAANQDAHRPEDNPVVAFDVHPDSGALTRRDNNLYDTHNVKSPVCIVELPPGFLLLNHAEC